MKLEQQVTSLELSKRLKELGVKQDSYFYWVKLKDNFELFSLAEVYIKELNKGESQIETYSAFTVAELGDMLPKALEMKTKTRGQKYMKFFLEFFWDDSDKKNTVVYRTNDELQIDYWVFKDAKTEAEARAKMLIYLLENKLITI